MKKGFTLIELLAVIIVLAIISLIATPVVLDLIESNKKKTAELNLEMIVRAADLYYFNSQTVSFKGTTFNCKNSVCLNDEGETLDIDGTIPDSGTISIDAKGDITLTDLSFGNYNCNKIEDDSYCGPTINFENSDTIVISEQNPINYRIFGASGGVGNYNLCKLFDENNKTGDACDGLNCVYYSTSYDNFTIDENGRIANTGGMLIGFIVDVEPNTTYTSSFNIVATKGSMSMRIREFSDVPSAYKDDNFITESINAATVWKTGLQYETFTTTETTEYILLTIYMPTTVGFVVDQIQLVEGDAYIPYGVCRLPITINNSLGTTNYNIDLSSPLSCVDNKCDYIDYLNKKVYRKDETVEDVTLPDIQWLNKNTNIIFETRNNPSKFVLYY